MANDDPDGGLEAPTGDVLDVDEDEIIETELPATVHERLAIAACKILLSRSIPCDRKTSISGQLKRYLD